MLLLKHTDSDGFEEHETDLVTTGQSKVSKRLKRRTSDKYHENTIVQRGCFRGLTSALKEKICQPAQAADCDVLKDSLENVPFIGTKQGVPTTTVKLVTRKTTQKACKISQIAPPIELEKSGPDQYSFRKRQMHRKIIVAGCKRKTFAVTDLIDSELYTAAEMAASCTEWKGNVVAFRTNSLNSPLAHKRFTGDDDTRQEQNNNHRKSMVLLDREEINQMKRRLVDAVRFAQYLTSFGSL